MKRYGSYWKRTRRFLLGVSSASLLLWLTACASVPPSVVTKTELVKPPAALLQDCPAPQFPSRDLSNLDLFNLLADYQDALAGCNDDKARLRRLYTE